MRIENLMEKYQKIGKFGKSLKDTKNSMSKMQDISQNATLFVQYKAKIILSVHMKLRLRLIIRPRARLNQRAGHHQNLNSGAGGKKDKYLFA